MMEGENKWWLLFTILVKLTPKSRWETLNHDGDHELKWTTNLQGQVFTINVPYDFHNFFGCQWLEFESCVWSEFIWRVYVFNSWWIIRAKHSPWSRLCKVKYQEGENTYKLFYDMRMGVSRWFGSRNRTRNTQSLSKLTGSSTRIIFLLNVSPSSTTNVFTYSSIRHEAQAKFRMLHIHTTNWVFLLLANLWYLGWVKNHG